MAGLVEFFFSNQAIALIFIVPLIGFLWIWLADKAPNWRELGTLLTSATLFLVVLTFLKRLLDGETPQLTLIHLTPDLPIAFEIEPLGMIFGLVASGLWIINSIYSIGYMRGTNEKNQTRFYLAFTIAIASALGIAFAANMLTLFIFYEVLTLSTFPLVTHKGTEEARRGGRIYLGILIGTSIGLQLTAIVWTYVLTGTLDFTAGGILSGAVQGPILAILLALYMFGIGKAALMPVHLWLPNAMVAPTPVSAFLHAVAVVKAGVFTVLKVTVYIFGIDFLRETGASVWLMWVAAASILLASAIAMGKDNLKARLAYSTVSQLSYVTLGAMLANAMGVIGGGMHIVMHAFGKMTLFMCAGAIYVATHKTNISDMRGLGRVMPFTFIAFFIGTLSIIGLPPLGGAWSKFLLMVAAADAGQLAIIGVLMLSSLLNVAYLLPISIRAFYASDGEPVGVAWGSLKEAPLLCVLPPVFTALGAGVLFFQAEAIYEFLAQIVSTGGGS